MIAPGLRQKAQGKDFARRNESFTRHAVKLHCHFCVWEEVEEIHNKKDLEEAIQIKQLFKAILDQMLTYTSGCREATLFETAKRLDKIVGETFLGNCQIDEKKSKDVPAKFKWPAGGVVSGKRKEEGDSPGKGCSSSGIHAMAKGRKKLCVMLLL